MAKDENAHIGLGEAELAALAEGEEDSREALAAIAAADDDEDDDPAAGEQTAAEDKPAEQQADAAATTGTETETTTDEEQEPAKLPSDFVPTYKAEPVPDFDKRMQGFKDERTQIKDERKALHAKFREGEMDMAEYQEKLDSYDEKLDDIAAQEADLRDKNTRAAITADLSNQNANSRWDWEQQRFFADKGNAIYKDSMLFAALNTKVKELAADAKNAQQPASWFLAEADKQVRGLMAPKGDGKQVQGKTPAEKTAETRTLNKGVLPKTLSGLPAADLSDTGSDAENEFADLDDMDGLELERAIAVMQRKDPDKFDRYIRANA